MSIELHCPKCSNLIKAPDNAGGKHGKCPYCQNKVYIPTPSSEVDEIPLAPIDEDAERTAEKLREESARYAATVSHAGEVPPEGADTGGFGGDSAVGLPMDAGEVIDVPENVAQFIYAMRDSKLEVADEVVARLKRNANKAGDYIDGIMVDATPPDFEGLPTPLVHGFLKTLKGRLK
jgi:hypothetical protein